MEGDVAPDVVGLHALGQQAIQRESLVIAARHQAFDHKASDLLHGEAPDDQGIEAVKGAEKALQQPAAFRRIGIGVGHMGEIGRQGGRAVHGDSVALRRRYPAGVRRQRDPESEDTADKGSNAPASRNAQHSTLF